MKAHQGFFELSKELGIPLNELLNWPGPMTYRQYLAWRAFLREDLNSPNRTDYYLMQIARWISTIARCWCPGVDIPNDDGTLNTMRIKFRNTVNEHTPNTAERNHRKVEAWHGFFSGIRKRMLERGAKES